jgi:hypothetical protein
VNEKHMEQHCENLLPYLLEELTQEQRKAFAQHLNQCERCREQLSDVRPVWKLMPLTVHEVDPPADLKDQVFSSIFPAERNESLLLETPRQTEVQPSNNHRETWWNPNVKFSWGAVAAALFILLIGVSWNNLQLRDQLSAIEDPLSSPVQVLQSYAMASADPSIEAVSGQGWLIRNGDQKRLVIQMDGLPSNRGDEVYQVWLIHNGLRQNAGTFRVDDRGRGLLTYEFDDPAIQFEHIGITLEPDPFGNQPRGKKVAGTIQS